MCYTLFAIDIMVYTIQTNTCEMMCMSSTVVQVRMDESLRSDATAIAEQLGLDLPTAIRVFLKKMVAERAVPFALALPRETPVAVDGLAAMRELGRRAEDEGLSEMPLEEIDAEIAAVREARMARHGA